ncbi:MAG: hypothetical protein K9N49_06295 [Candidatus Marinimicrobia bacterium]|nr:hypothetical protein [Candidatus Neomarinimicrobiota bacterium]
MAATGKPVIAFIHQQLDGTGDLAVGNAPRVREILQKAKRVLGIFADHHTFHGHLEEHLRARSAALSR